MDTKANLLIFIKEKNLSKTDFYKITGLSNGFLDKGGSVTSSNLETILKHFPEISADWLITGEGPMLRSELPVAHHATEPDAGVPLIPIDAIAGIPAGESIAVRFIDCAKYTIPEFANLNVEYMIRVSGSSMYPKYSNGDVLACRRVHDILFFQWGKIYVIYSSQGPLVKRVFQDEDPDRILLVSDNKEHYPPFSIPKSDIRSLSIVLGVIRLE